jgi:hypothetical protein
LLGAGVVIELDAADATDVPLAFAAVTVKVYEVDELRPEIVIGDEPVPVAPPGLAVAVKVVAVAPITDAVYATVAVEALVAVATPIVGGIGLATDVLPRLALNSVLLRLASVFILLIGTMQSPLPRCGN